MMDTRRALLGLVVVSAVLTIIGCHSAPPPETFADEVLNAAINSSIPMKPALSPQGTDCSQGLMLMMTDPPQTREAMSAALSDWTEAANLHPNDAACQLGLCMMMIARAVDNVAIDLGHDLFEAPDLLSANPLALMALATSDGPGGVAGPHAASLRGRTAAVGTAQLGLLASLDMDAQAAIRAHLLPALYTSRGSVYNRLSYFTALSAGRALVTLEDSEGIVGTMHAADFNLICAGVAGLSGFLADACAYNTDRGRWAPAPTLGEMDQDSDNTLTPTEYLPPAPYGTLNPDGAAQLSDAYLAYRAAVTHARAGLTSIPDDSSDLLRALLGMDLGVLGAVNAAQMVPPRLDVERLLLVLDHLDALLSGPQQLTIEYWAEGGAHQQLDFTVDITRVYLNPLADIRGIMPSLPLIDMELARAAEDSPLSPILDMFPDLTFNGVAPDFEELIGVLETADYVTLVHGDQDWGVTDLTYFHLLTEELRTGLGGDDFGFPTDLPPEEIEMLPEMLLLLIMSFVAF